MENTNNPNSPNREGPNESPDQMTTQVAAFQKIWMETLTKLVQTAMTIPPDSAPPDVMRQMRSGVFQGLAKTWDEFLRSPQFLEGMKQWMDTAIFMRKWSNEFLNRSHHEMQGTAREDIDSVMLAVRHMEKRLLDRLEQLETKVEALSQPASRPTANGGAGSTAASAVKPSRRNVARASKPASKARKTNL